MLVQFETYNLNFGTKYPKISKQDLRECLHAGWTYKQIAEKFGISVEAVSRSLNWYGLKSRRTLEREQNIKNVINLANQGYSKKGIRVELGINTDIINRILSKYSKSGTKSDPILEEVARKLNLTSEDLKKYLK